VHLTIGREHLPIEHALYIAADDGRMIFLIPRESVVYIGTTDTDYQGDLQKPLCTVEDAHYLLRAVNQQFPGAQLTLNHVLSSWAGLRPLLHEPGKGPTELSRKEEIFKSRSGLYSIAGGKLTGFRKMAEKIVDLAVADLTERVGSGPYALRPCTTSHTPLSGGDIGEQGLESFRHSMFGTGVEQYGLGKEVLHRLLRLYGSNVRTIFRYLDEDISLKKRGVRSLPIIRAEIKYAVEQEMVVSLTDYLLRRTGDLLFAKREAERAAPELLAEFAAFLDWGEGEMWEQWQRWEAAVNEYRPCGSGVLI
jgi:glycerol-3-phosphate dehydrogenase